MAAPALTAEIAHSAETVQAESSEQPSTAPTGTSGSESDAATLHSRSETAASASTAVNTTSQGDANKNKPEDKERSEKGDANLVGKINNLVTSDLASIVGGSDFLVALVSCPLAFSFSMGFLYIVLGWRYVLLLECTVERRLMV